MWANARRDGRPAEYRWRPLFNAAKLLLECRAVMLQDAKPVEICRGGSNSPNRYQPLVSRSSPYCEDMWERYCCLTNFVPIVDTCLSCEDVAQQSCAMVPRWRIFGDYLRPAFSASRVQQVSDLHSKFAVGPHRVSKYGRHSICNG